VACTVPPTPPIYNPNLGYSAPITITTGGTYSGRWRSTDPSTPAVTIATSEDVVIENSIVVGKGHLIKGSMPGKIMIRNTQGFGLSRWAAGEAPGKFAELYGSKGVIIENNYMEHVWGIYIQAFAGSGNGAETVKLRYNQFRNAESLPSSSSGHPVQFNGVRAANIEVAWNEIINEPFISRTEDVISIYDSGGTQASPLLIHNNYIQGAYPGNPVSDGFSGSGTMVETNSAWVIVRNNQVVSTTNVGIGMHGGHDVQITNNRVLSSGLLPDGRFIGAQNVGLVVWDLYGTGAAFVNNYAANNIVAWNQKDGSGNVIQNNWWFPNCAPGMCTGNTAYGSVPTLAMEAAERELWKSTVAGACVRIGTQ
jgi:hypothetical protein